MANIIPELDQAGGGGGARVGRHGHAKQVSRNKIRKIFKMKKVESEQKDLEKCCDIKSNTKNINDIFSLPPPPMGPLLRVLLPHPLLLWPQVPNQASSSENIKYYE